jgi:hypothetical protein
LQQMTRTATAWANARHSSATTSNSDPYRRWQQINVVVQSLLTYFKYDAVGPNSSAYSPEKEVLIVTGLRRGSVDALWVSSPKRQVTAQASETDVSESTRLRQITARSTLGSAQRGLLYLRTRLVSVPGWSSGNIFFGHRAQVSLIAWSGIMEGLDLTMRKRCSASRVHTSSTRVSP